MAAPLAGIRVICAGGAAAAAYAAKLLEDLGAEVTRSDSPPFSAALASAQVLLCGSSDGGVPSKTELEALARAHPALVIAAISPFGLDDASNFAANDLTLQAYAGISLPIGVSGKPPLKLPGDQTSYQAGLSAAIAAVGALFARRGALLDIAAADVWAAFYTGVDVAMAHFGRYRKIRAGHRVQGQPYPRTIYRCKDGYFAIQCGESRHWQAFLRMIDREDLATHPLFGNRFKANDEHGDACDALVEPWFLARTKNEVLAECLEHRIPGAPVYNVREVVEHPHLRERGYFPARNLYASVARRASNVPSSLRQAATDAANSAAAVTTGAATTRPLAGLRVVDFGWVWAGAVPGHILADLGAEVIKIESASPLDYMRQGRPIVGKEKDPEQNPMFQNVNRGKLSLRLKLDHADSRALLLDLVAASDVVIENFSPGVMEKFGLGYEALTRVRPDIVMCSMSAVGQAGPLRGIRTYATMIASLAGLDSLVAYPGERVLGSQSSYADPNASLHATLGILAALWRRANTGEGAHLDLSQWEAAVNVMGEHVDAYLATRRVAEACGVHDANKAPHGHYPAGGDDRWIAISVDGDRQWSALREALGSPEWMSDASFGTHAARCANRDALDGQLGNETVKFDATALASRLAAAGVPAAPLLDPAGIVSDTHFRARGLFETVEHPVLGALPVYRLPWRVDGRPIALTRRAPLLGEHNDYVLRDVLRYDEARRDQLLAGGVFT